MDHGRAVEPAGERARIRAGQLADALKAQPQNLTLPPENGPTQLANLLTGSDSARQKEIDRLKTQYEKLYGEVSALGPDVAEASVNKSSHSKRRRIFKRAIA